MASVRKAFIYSSASQYFLKLLSFISVITFARLLSPEEIGLFAIASSVILIATEFRLLGTTNYLVREENITTDHIRSGVGLTMLISWTMGIALFFAAPSIATFYDKAVLSDLFKVLSFSFFVAPFISVSSSMLSRELKFDKIVLVNFTTQVSKFLVTLTLILQGFSFYALAIGVALGSLIEVTFYYFLRPSIVSWKPSFKNLKPIAKFGVYSSLTNMLSRFELAASDIIIGKVGSASQVALFSRGTGFLSFITQTIASGIWPVALPYLSKVKRDGGDLHGAYIKASTLIGALVWPAIAVAGVASYPVIYILFGEQWLGSVPLVPILSIWGIFRIVHTLCPSLLISTGYERMMLIKQIIFFVLTFVCVYVGFQYGLEGVAWGLAFVAFSDFVMSAIVLYIAIKLGFFQFLRGIASCIMLTLTCLGAALLLDYWMNFETTAPLISLLTLMLVMPLVWLLSVFVFRHPIYFEIKRLLPIGK